MEEDPTEVDIREAQALTRGSDFERDRAKVMLLTAIARELLRANQQRERDVASGMGGTQHFTR